MKDFLPAIGAGKRWRRKGGKGEAESGSIVVHTDGNLWVEQPPFPTREWSRDEVKMAGSEIG